MKAGRACADCSTDLSGYHSQTVRCAGCKVEHKRKIGLAYYQKNADRIRKRANDWHHANPDRAREAKRAWYEASRDAERERHRRRYQGDGRQLALDRATAHYQANRERVLERARSDEGRKRARERQRRLREDPAHRLYMNTSRMVRDALAERKAGRGWEALVGYSLADLTAHLERQFGRGMSWSNYGDWHIDHIVPRAAHHFTGPEDPEFRACWALTNLRPMWATENKSKSAKRTHLL